VLENATIAIKINYYGGGGMAEAVQEKDEVKQRAIKRLLVAVVLVIIAVGILTYLSYYKPTKVVTKPTPETLPPPPPPIVTGPEPQIVQPAPAEALPELPPPLPAEAPATQPEPTPLPPPPPPAVSSKPLPQPGPGPKKVPTSAPKPLEQKPEELKPLVPAQNAPQAVPTPSKPSAGGQGYVVQFGVFSNPQNALQLVEKLKQAGIAAQTETHVQLPPFKTRAEADAALAKMREKGLTATVVAR